MSYTDRNLVAAQEKQANLRSIGRAFNSLLAPRVRMNIGAGTGALLGGYAGSKATGENPRFSRKLRGILAGSAAGLLGGAAAGGFAPSIIRRFSPKMGRQLSLRGRMGSQVNRFADATKGSKNYQEAAKAHRSLKAQLTDKSYSPMTYRDYAKGALGTAGTLAALGGTGYITSGLQNELFKT